MNGPNKEGVVVGGFLIAFAAALFVPAYLAGPPGAISSPTPTVSVTTTATESVKVPGPTKTVEVEVKDERGPCPAEIAQDGRNAPSHIIKRVIDAGGCTWLP